MDNHTWFEAILVENDLNLKSYDLQKCGVLSLNFSSCIILNQSSVKPCLIINHHPLCRTVN